jgi:hypothetical protein
MPIRMTKPSEGGNFGVTIEDRFDATEDHIVELMSMDEYQGVSTIDGKPYTSIMWHCRIYDEHGIAFLNMIDNSPYDFVEFSSMSLAKGNKVAKAREWAGAFLGHELSDAECEAIAENFDGSLVGKQALASWKLEDDKKNGGKKLKFALLRPVPARLRRNAAPAYPAQEVNGNSPVPPAAPPAAPAPTPAARETAAERRARLEAELAAMDDGDAVTMPDDDDIPF